MRKNRTISGFTFVELAVVICILSVLMLFSMPMFERIHLFSNKAPTTASLVSLIQSLKQSSISENKTFYLNININTGQVWVTHASMNREAQAEAFETAIVYDNGTIIQNLEYPDRKRTDSSICQVQFFKEGCSDSVLVHLREKDEDVTLKIGTFLMKVERFNRYVSFDDCI